MKPFICAALVLLGVLAAPAPAAAPDAPSDATYVIPIHDMIERALVYVIRRGVAQAEREGAGVIIFDMHTPGGRLDATQEIINTITGLDVPTLTFVNRDAISAGAIIAMATDDIYMAPGSRIGDAMPILMSPLPFGGPQEIPTTLREKIMSPTAALIRDAAQRKGHDVTLAEAMVRPEIEYRVDDLVICPEGQILTLTSQDATQLVGPEGEQRPLLAKGIANDLDDLLRLIGRDGTRLVVLGVSPAERIARVIEGFPVSSILLALGILGLYIEFKTPGFGLPGIGGAVLLLIWFWGHHIAGMVGTAEMLIFLLGVALIFVEIFVIPGFGVVGASGITLVFVALLMAMVQHYPATPWYHPPAVQLQDAIQALGVSLTLVFLGGVLLAKFLPRTPVFQKIALNATVGRREGVVASTAQDENLTGVRGVAATPLRPAGIGRFGARRLNVVARGEFMDKGDPIVIAETAGNRIVVERDGAPGYAAPVTPA